MTADTHALFKAGTLGELSSGFRFFLWCSPALVCLLRQKTFHRLCEWCQMRQELAQLISHAHRSCDGGTIGWLWHFQNGFDLFWVRIDTLSGDAVSKKFNFVLGKLTFVLVQH